MKKFKIKWYQLILYTIFLFSIGVLFYCHFHSNVDNVQYGQAGEVIDYSSGWSYIKDGKKEGIKLPGKIEAPSGTWVTIIKKLPEKLCENAALAFRTDHNYVKVYAEDELIYSFGEKDGMTFGSTPGSIWNIVEIPSKFAGKELTIKYMCPYDKYSGDLRMIYYGSKSQLLIYSLQDGIGLLVVSIFPGFVGIFIIALALIFRKEVKTVALFDLGILCLISSGWGLSESRFMQFFYDNEFVIETASFLFFAIMSIAIIIVLYDLGILINKKIFYSIGIADIATFVLINLLQFTEVTDYFNTLILVQFLLIITFVVPIINILIQYIRAGKKKYAYITGALCAVIAFLAMLDLIDFYVWEKFGNGFFTRISVLILIAIAATYTTHQTIRKYKFIVEKNILEKLAYSDGLTGLGNRRAFDDQMSKLASVEDKFYLAVLDLNNLKKINDNYGHDMGDMAIKTVGIELEHLMNEKCFCYRTGGDEFAILAIELTEDMLEKICQNIKRYLDDAVKEKDFIVGIAYGLVRYSQKDFKTLKEAYYKADCLMYEKKTKMKKEDEVY